MASAATVAFAHSVGKAALAQEAVLAEMEMSCSAVMALSGQSGRGAADAQSASALATRLDFMYMVLDV
jgi:hypothetical protein